MIVEIFAGTGRVTAALKSLGMDGAFGTDHKRHKQAMSPIVLADLTTTAGIELLMQWLSIPYIVGIFLAPPCGTASRARSIPMKRKRPGDPEAPRPLRSDRHPNGVPFLQFKDRIKVCQANKLYHLTAKLIQWAVDTGCMFCVENPQYSFFWQTTFIQEVNKLLQFTTFQSCRYGSKRPKRTMLAFNVEEFAVINKMCEGTSATHKHEKWGVDSAQNKFATAVETAYPMPLARLIATQFIMALQRMCISLPPSTLSQVTERDGSFLSVLRAQTGHQSRVSKLPPLIPTFAAKCTLSGFRDDLPEFEVNQKLSSKLEVHTTNAPTVLPKGSKLLQIGTSLLPSSVLSRGVFVSGQHLSQEEVERIVSSSEAATNVRDGFCESQVWGVPWTETDFAQQMLKFSHPSTLRSCLPQVLKDVVESYKVMSAHERMSYRASKLGYWLKVLIDLKGKEQELKDAMDGDVKLILQSKNICLWEAMLKALHYDDLGVVEEFQQGSELVGCVEATGVWPMKFQPATVTVGELCEVATKERWTVFR